MNCWSKVHAVWNLRDGHDSVRIGESVATLYEARSLPDIRPFVLFVHGYNTSQAAARESYARFRWWLEWFDTPSKVIEIHWPGDLKWGPASKALYPVRIRTAKKCGVLLAHWIRKQPREAKFVIVAHSLGCRLTLEAVKKMRQLHQSFRLVGICLMAAAVPVKHVAFRRLGPLSEEAVHWRILYSRGDTVLRKAFPFGQFFGVDAPFSYPVGLYGEPAERWKASGETCELSQETRRDDDPDFYDHGYYWQGGPRWNKTPLTGTWLPDIPPPRKNRGASANEVAKMLGGKARQVLPLRHIEPARSLPQRIIGQLF